MICNICGSQEATIHLTEIINNQMMEVHLCEACAQEKGTDFKTHFNLSDLVAGLADIQPAIKAGEKKSTAKCPECGMTYEEFGKTGRLGCGTCYQAFSKMLLPLIKRVQRSTQHVGKRPSKVAPESAAVLDLKLLQERLRKSVASEAFEEAAQLRDEIKTMEDKVKKPKKNKNEQS